MSIATDPTESAATTRHELEIRADGSAMMFYAGELPWHGLGEGVADAQTSEEAIKLAGLDWEVEVGPLYGPNMQPIDDMRAIVRTLDGKVLGTAGPGYNPWQNHEGFEFLDGLHKDGVVTYDAAGSLFGGKRIFISARLSEDMRIADEEYVRYLLLVLHHDAHGAIKAVGTDVRAVCNNTVNRALTAGPLFKISHTKNMDYRLSEAQRMLQISTEQSRNFKAFMERAALAKVDSKQELKIQTAIFGSLDEEPSKLKQNAIELFKTIYEAEQALNGRTAYSLVQAATGYIDHGKRYLGDSEKRIETRFASLVDPRGVGFQQKQDVLTIVGRMEGVKA